MVCNTFLKVQDFLSPKKDKHVGQFLSILMLSEESEAIEVTWDEKSDYFW